MWEAWIDVKPEVAKALRDGTPVVALESTIIAHGMPYPKNLETARELEAIIREEGAVPATIAILGGRIRIGLEDLELEHLALSDRVRKVSRRDIPDVLVNGEDGATTVAATMLAASIAGIEVFATGGIGGVHRHYGEVLDISQDLEELGRTDVAVVCAGVKSILDIRSTLEVLETKSVPVYVIGSDEFPAFFTRSSGIAAERRIDDLETMARAIRLKWRMGLAGGVVVANPIPETAAIPRETIDDMIADAIEKSRDEGISGKEMTPYLLDRISRESGGVSLAANIALVRSNARVAARLAKLLINI